MGKIKANQAISMKISKSKLEDNGKKQLNKLIKDLRPKVYITDSSSFKRLVQELTGNGNINNTTTIPISPHRDAPPTTNINTNSPHPLLLLEDEIIHDHEVLFQFESSLEMSSVDSESLELMTSWAGGSIRDQLLSTCANTDDPSSYLLNNQHQMADISQLRDVESWLLEMDHHRRHHQYKFPNYYYDPSEADEQAFGVGVWVYGSDHLYYDPKLI